jgi:CRP/FNR family transcriptional regulator, cyclic AMP receptor protein
VLQLLVCAATLCVSAGLSDNELFGGLSEEALGALQRIKRTTFYGAGAKIFTEGEGSRGVYILCHGRAKLLMTGSSGRCVVLRIVHPGEGLVLSSVITANPYDVTAEVLQPSQISFIAREDFLKFIATYSDACLNFVRDLSRDCDAARSQIRSIVLSESASERVAQFLLRWASDGDGPTPTHEEIAQLTGIARETVTRIVCDFKKRQLIEMTRSTLTVTNKLALENIAGDSV